MQLVQRRFVLIASPSDVLEERAAAYAAINEWNHAPGNKERSVVFIPLMWERSAAAVANMAPQAAINDQLVRDADYVLAIFNARLGTPTEAFISGTVEEITILKDSAAVFFRRDTLISKKSAEAFSQLQRLSTFQEELEKHGLCHCYEDVDHIAELTTKQLNYWAQKSEGDGGVIPIFVRGKTLRLKAFAECALFASEPLTLLMYNAELNTFYSPVIARLQNAEAQRTFA